MELGLNLYSTLFFRQVQYLKDLQKKESKMNKLKYPIVYHPKYNISAFGFEKLHPFDSQKFGRIYSLLLRKNVIIDESNIHQPTNINRALLATVIISLCELYLISHIGTFKNLSISIVL